MHKFILPIYVITIVSGFVPQHQAPQRRVERYIEWKKKEALAPQGNVAGVVGNLPVSFKIIGTETKKDTLAFAGEGLSEVAAKADIFIKYKCRKGECGTCEVMLDGKWIKACQTKIPGPLGNGQPYTISVRDIPDDKKSKKSSSFFSPQSFVDGFTANALGMVGLVVEGAKEDDNFNVRMEKERLLAEKVAAKKKAKGD